MFLLITFRMAPTFACVFTVYFCLKISDIDLKVYILFSVTHPNLSTRLLYANLSEIGTWLQLVMRPKPARLVQVFEDLIWKRPFFKDIGSLVPF